MLTHLAIDNFAIIDRVRVDLEPGLVVLTGETGAGKSIIVDAVGGVLGNRLGVDVIRAEANEARIEGVFATPPSDELAAILDELGIAKEDDLVVTREINRSGRGVARVNGRIVPLSALQRIGRHLMDLHGQGEHLALLRVPEHLRFLDGYAGLNEPRDSVRALVEQIRAIRAEREALSRDQRQLARQMDLLRFQLEEIDGAGLQDGEDELLRQERSRLANAEKLASGIDAVRDALAEGEAGPALDRLGDAARVLADLARLDPSLAEHQQALELAIDQVAEVSQRVRRYREEIEFNPERLEEIEERLNLIRGLERKYGSTIADVLAFAEQARTELDALEHREEHVADLDAREQDLLSQLADEGQRLSAARQAAARDLERAVEAELAELNMGGARFRVAIDQVPDATGVSLPDGRTVSFDLSGIDRVEFFIATNAGEEHKPLVKVVSGGETARLMLALKNILSRADAVPTLIFDEIDTGIGGHTAVVVGRKIAALARDRQVICVTHLPQIASFADLHLSVRKQIENGRTVARVGALDRDGRVDELATMVGGESARVSARDHARSALEDAAEWKSELAFSRGGSR